MKLIRAVSCWGNDASPAEALDLAVEWGFEAVEARVTGNFSDIDKATSDAGKHLIAEIVTGCDSGGYVPRPEVPLHTHLEDFRRLLDLSLPSEPLRITVLAGSDLWDFSTTCLFYAQLLEISAQAGAMICVETHRARPTFHPVQTSQLLNEFPELRLTLDVSHWCAVCERLIAAEPSILETIVPRVRHVHARIGYDQGPQVPDPRVARYARELNSHFSCWESVAQSRKNRRKEYFTVTPEFGPDGYLQSHPVTGSPAANLRELNRWMGDEIARRWIAKV